VLFATAAVVAFLFLWACPAAAQQEPPVVPESYILKQRQHDFANNVWQWLNETSQAYVRNEWHDGSRADCSSWTPEKQRCIFAGNWESGPPWIEFSKPFYSPDTTIVYGSPVPVKDVDENVAGQAADADNRGGAKDFNYELARTFALENTVSSTYSQSYEIDVTLSSKTTIEGSYYGVKFEEELTATLETDFTQSESQTKSFVETRTQEVKETVVVPPYSHYIIRFAERQATNNVPYTVRGVFDWAFCVGIPNYPVGGRGWIFRQTWANGNPGWKNNEICFTSITDFRQAVYGYNPAWPHVPNGYWKGDTTDWFTGDNWRMVDLKGQQRRLSVAENSIVILDVTDCGEDDLDGIKTALDKPFDGVLDGYDCVKRNPKPPPCPWWKRIVKRCALVPVDPTI